MIKQSRTPERAKELANKIFIKYEDRINESTSEDEQNKLWKYYNLSLERRGIIHGPGGYQFKNPEEYWKKRIK